MPLLICLFSKKRINVKKLIKVCDFLQGRHMGGINLIDNLLVCVRPSTGKGSSAQH